MSEAARIRMLEARCSAYYERVQGIFKESQKGMETPESIELFLSTSETVDTIHDQFMETLEEINEKKMNLDPTYEPNFKIWNALEDIFCRIKRKRNLLLGTTKDVKPNLDLQLQKGKPKLPPIEVQSFNGDSRSWPLFYASFKSTVHENASLTDAEKLYYLIGKLVGKAQTVCAGITPCGENYKVIFDALIDKYEDKRQMATTYLNQMFEMKPLTTSSYYNLNLFIDNFVSSVASLKNLNLPNLTDFMLLHIALKRLDSDTVRAFEMHYRNSETPTFDNLTAFVKEQAKIVQRSSNTKSDFKRNNYSERTAYGSAPVNTTGSAHKCLCKNTVHEQLFKCPQFLKITPNDRFKFIKDLNGCVNCLSSKHKLVACNSQSTCKKCGLKHHSLLHFEQNTAGPSNVGASVGVHNTDSQPTTQQARASPIPSPPSSQRVSAEPLDATVCNMSSARSITTAATTVHKATARVIVHDKYGNTHYLRCLLDSASQSNFITQSCCTKLGLIQCKQTSAVIKGIGGSMKFINGIVNLQFFSRFNMNINFNIDSLVVDKITDTLPVAIVDTSALSGLNKLQLADDKFFIPGNIDMLIEASLFPHLLLPGKIESSPAAIETVLGYVIMGSVPILSSNNTLTSCCTTMHEDTDSILRKFWEIEEINPDKSSVLSKQDIDCENIYKNTTTRDDSGRYVVALPFSGDVSSLGDSYTTARKRFLCLERKLEASPKLRRAYDEVIKEYLDKQYLSPVPQDDRYDQPSYTIPHHGIIREDKSTTKLRIVLDASAKTSTAVSLNDILHAGPNLQDDLFSILLNFRLFAIALTADVRQMYLQLVVRDCDRKYQRILYRFSPNEPLAVYNYNRVCFGVKSSPYLALRTIQKLVSDEGEKYELAKNIASGSLYMDDFVFSISSENEAITASAQLIQLLKRGTFDLVKWSSNSETVLKSIPDSHRMSPEVEFDKTVQHKILGVHWLPTSDTFGFKVTSPGDKCTKRIMLSTVARLFDVLGLVAPTILYAKLLIKQLWLLKIDWDDAHPPDIVRLWQQFCQELPLLNDIKIPRHLGVVEGSTVTLLGFADASEKAYGGVVFLHINIAGQIFVQLVCAKSKVSPVKTLSVARLELCGAVLLSQLILTVLDNYSPRYNINKVYAFSDSRVTLCWIHSSPHRWQTFVANRVVKIIEKVSASDFYHIPGMDNPADCLSRGLTPSKLIDHPLWYHGPSWACVPVEQWPITPFNPAGDDDVPEQKVVTCAAAVAETEEPLLYSLANRMSSWSKLLRTIIFIYRFCKILPNKKSTVATSFDLEFAENKLIKCIQSIYFANDLTNLQKGKLCSPALQRLKPFLRDGIIRVGGRLSNSDLKYDSRCPVILPRQSHAIELLVGYNHKRYCHAGPTWLISVLRQNYWILSARRLVRRIVHKCNVCFKLRPKANAPEMSDHKACRVIPTVKAFTHTGTDFAGPLKVSMTRGRGIRSQKAYACLFICLATRAVHIELASNLSTACFLDAFKRFLSRRGPVSDIYSDNGTNFVGAKTYLNDLHNLITSQEYKDKFQNEIAENRINWHLNAPSAPHFGGSWESNVKSMKAHLFRVIGTQILSYEEMSTVLAQVEAIMNTRPLCSMQCDPDDPLPLTPAHFLTFTPLKSLPAQDIAEERLHLLTRYSLLDKIVQSFWKRWKSEYITTLQVREKWNTPAVPIRIGNVVLINQDNAPPLYWPMGIVEKVYPSKDGKVRVALVRTSKGSYTRPVVKLCPLPTQ